MSSHELFLFLYGVSHQSNLSSSEVFVAVNGISNGFWSTNVVLVSLRTCLAVCSISDGYRSAHVLFIFRWEFLILNSESGGFRSVSVIVLPLGEFEAFNRRESLIVWSTVVSWSTEMIFRIRIRPLIGIAQWSVESETEHTRRVVICCIYQVYCHFLILLT